MNTQNRIIVALAFAVLIGIIFLLVSPRDDSEISTEAQNDTPEVMQVIEGESGGIVEETQSVTDAPSATQETQTYTPTDSPVTTVPKTITPSTSKTPTTSLIPTISREAMKKYWDLIDTSLLAITLDQIDLYNSINTKKIDCDPETFNCKEKIKAQYAVYENIEREGFVYGWEDANQAILSTDIYKTNVHGYTHYAKDFLYFYTNKDDKRIILSYHTDSLETDSLVEATLMFTDPDFDGLGTIREKCETPYKNDPSCFVTDPSVRDTDGDGWWDGIEVYL